MSVSGAVAPDYIYNSLAKLSSIRSVVEMGVANLTKNPMSPMELLKSHQNLAQTTMLKAASTVSSAKSQTKVVTSGSSP